MNFLISRGVMECASISQPQPVKTIISKAKKAPAAPPRKRFKTAAYGTAAYGWLQEKESRGTTKEERAQWYAEMVRVSSYASVNDMLECALSDIIGDTDFSNWSLDRKLRVVLR